MIWTMNNSQQVQAIAEIEHSKSDRVVAIVSGAMVEQRLETSLRYRLRSHENRQEQLFKPTGPLGAFKNKIDLGFLLFMYEKPTWVALTSISQIRNKFAHQLEQSFDSGDDKFNQAMKGLSLHDGVKFYPNPVMWCDTEERLTKPKTNRQIFVANVKLALIALMRDTMVHTPESNQAVIPPIPDGPISLPTAPAGSGYIVRRRPRRTPKG
jgi:hypothetical protein